MAMFYSNVRNALVSILLTVAFTGFFTGEVDGNLSGISAFYQPVVNLEENIFRQAREARQFDQIQYQQKMEKRILNVISQFKTGLKYEDRTRIPQRILRESKKYGYDPLFLTAVIITESSFYNWAKSRQGALGLMQILLPTGLAMASETRIKWRGKPTLYDPEMNIILGAYYLNKLTLRFGDLSLALEAYNRGPSRVVSNLRRGYTPWRYSKKVFRNYDRIRTHQLAGDAPVI